MDIQPWMQSYIDSFFNGEWEHDRNIVLKREHSQRVQDEIGSLGAELGLVGRDLDLTKVMGLLHDSGRFEQFARYRTFNDNRSVDHHKIRAALPDDPQVDEIYSAVISFMKDALPVEGGPAGREKRLVL